LRRFQGFEINSRIEGQFRHVSSYSSLEVLHTRPQVMSGAIVPALPSLPLLPHVASARDRTGLRPEILAEVRGTPIRSITPLG